MKGLEKYSLRQYSIPFQVGLLADWKILHLHFMLKFYIPPQISVLCADLRVSLKNAEFARNKNSQILHKKRRNSVRKKCLCTNIRRKMCEKIYSNCEEKIETNSEQKQPEKKDRLETKMIIC